MKVMVPFGRISSFKTTFIGRVYNVLEQDLVVRLLKAKHYSRRQIRCMKVVPKNVG